MQPIPPASRLGPALIAAAGLVAGAATALLIATSSILVDPEASAVARTGFVVANVAGGAYTWMRRPASGFGLRFATVGLLFAVTSLNALSAPLPYTLGRLAYPTVILATLYVFLCFPRDHIAARGERRFLAAFTLAEVALWVLTLLFADEFPAAGPFSDCGDACPDNPLQVTSGTAGDAFGIAATALLIAGLLAVTLLLLARARSARRIARRSLTPLLAAMSAMLIALAAYTVVREVGDQRSDVLSVAVAASILLLPVALLVGQLRGRLFAAARLGGLVTEADGVPVTAADVEARLADALGDPTFTLARFDEAAAGYRDMSGAPVALPDRDGERAAVEFKRDGRPFALAVYDPDLAPEPDVVRGVVATGVMLLDNAQLLDELRASRARIAEANHVARVTVERDLHDGAQPLLSALLIKLGIARDIATDTELRALLDEAGDDVAGAVEELRRLARGVYPPVLRERGAGEALRAFALTAPVSVRVDETGTPGATAAAQAAVYFAALEAIQNAIKHAGPGVHVVVTLEHGVDAVRFAVSDDGVGFDARSVNGGVGLTSMKDRIGAAGGRLDVESTPGRGTIVRGRVPAR